MEEKFIGTRSRRTANDYAAPCDTYHVWSDRRGNWNMIYRYDNPYSYDKKTIYYDSLNRLNMDSPMVLKGVCFFDFQVFGGF